MAGGIHRFGDLNTPHSCPPYSPSGFGFPSCSMEGCATVFVNGLPVTTASHITMWHPCTDWDDWGWHPGVYIWERTVLAEGMPVQAVGDINSCKAVLASGSENVIVGG